MLPRLHERARSGGEREGEREGGGGSERRRERRVLLANTHDAVEAG